jgi:hypothetical protein
MITAVFQIDISVCPACLGKMMIIAFITDPASVRRHLEGEGLPTQPPMIAQARPPPQVEFDY